MINISDSLVTLAYLAPFLRYSNLVNGQKSQIFPTHLSFSALAQGGPFRIYGKALRILKLESSRQPTVKIW